MGVQKRFVVRGCGTTEPAVGLTTASRHGRRYGWIAAVVGGLLLAVLTVSANAIMGGGDSREAAVLAARDPGARLGGNTIVGTGTGARVFGVPDRPNFIAALGSGETIVGGARSDQLGALADNVTIRGGGGNDLINGGRGATIFGGPGRDLIIDRKDDATVRLTSSGNEVVVSGRNDRVLCAKGSRNNIVHAGASDFVSRTCHTAGARVLAVRDFDPALSAQASEQPYLSRPSPPPAQAAQVKGAGTNNDPYHKACDVPGQGCNVTFPARSLTGFWANESVPAYGCPPTNIHLNSTTYAPFGTSLPPGVEVRGLGRIGVAITATGQYLVEGIYADRTSIGFPDSSATNWTGGTHKYQVILHCTSS